MSGDLFFLVLAKKPSPPSPIFGAKGLGLRVSASGFRGGPLSGLNGV